MIKPQDYRLNKLPTTQSRQRARELRAAMSPPERLLWSAMRGKKIAGMRFRRQSPVGPYIADFYCHETRLVVEVDGSMHSGEGLEHDRKRDKWMLDRGIRVLRVQALDVFKNLDGVVRTIEQIFKVP